MTRIRINNNVPAGDGGAFSGHCRPPLTHLSPDFTAAFTEYDNVTGRLGIARGKLLDYTNPGKWTVAQEKARRLDAQASAEAARKGGNTGGTKNIEDLHAAKRQAEADVEALTGAIYLVQQDLAALREKAQQTEAAKLAKAEADARARLSKSTEQVAADAQALVDAIAHREWVMDHKPWDASIGVNVLDVWTPGQNQLSGAVRHVPILFPKILEAINNL